MSVTHTIKEDIFTLVIQGDFTAVDFLDALEQGMGAAGFKAPMRALIDARKAEGDFFTQLNAAQGRFYAEIGHCFIPHWAVVAVSDDVLFGIARMICTISDLRGVDMRAYEDIDEARCRLTWSNFYQQDPFCRMEPTSCRPNFVRPSVKV